MRTKSTPAGGCRLPRFRPEFLLPPLQPRGAQRQGKRVPGVSTDVETLSSKRTAAVLVLLLMAVPLLTRAGEAAPAGLEHRPDLRTLPPADLQIDTSTKPGRKLLRFSNTVWNAGDGRLELRPENVGGQTKAYQRLYTHDAAGAWSLLREEQAGTFDYHEAHLHWHFNKFAQYVVRRDVAGTVGPPLGFTGEKTTFCIIDTVKVATLPHSPSRAQYTQCNQDSTTGISVGWGDKYGWWLDGQWVDVTGLADGVYWLESSATTKLVETDTSNNAAATRFRLLGVVALQCSLLC